MTLGAINIIQYTFTCNQYHQIGNWWLANKRYLYYLQTAAACPPVIITGINYCNKHIQRAPRFEYNISKIYNWCLDPKITKTIYYHIIQYCSQHSVSTKWVYEIRNLYTNAILEKVIQVLETNEANWVRLPCNNVKWYTIIHKIQNSLLHSA